MANYSVTGRNWYNTGRGWYDGAWIQIATSSQSARVVGDHWEFTFYAKIESQYWSTDISNLSGAYMVLRAFTNPSRTNKFAEVSIPIDGSLFGNGATNPFGPLRINAAADIGTVYFEIDCDVTGIPSTNIGIEDVGYGYIHHLYEYGEFYVEDIPLNPKITAFTWDDTRITSSTVRYTFSANQNISQARVQITNMDTGASSSEITLPSLGGSGSNRSFTLGNDIWNGFEYARTYRVKLWVKSEGGRWNTDATNSQRDSKTGNHKPSVSYNQYPHLDWYNITWSETEGASVSYSSGYPNCSGGALNTSAGNTASGNFSYKNLQPSTAYTFKMKFETIRRFEDSKFGDYKSDEYSITGTTLAIARPTVFPGFNFADNSTVTILNNSERPCVLEAYCGGTLIWSATRNDTGTFTVTKTMDQNELDVLYRKYTTSNTVTMEYRVITQGLYGTYNTGYSNATCTLTGNAKTIHVGVNNVPRRSKGFVGVNNVPRRCVYWVGDNDNKPRRCI